MNTSNDITIYLVIGTLTMLGLAGSIILFVVFYQKRLLKNKFTIQQMETDYQKDLLQSTIDSQEKEVFPVDGRRRFWPKMQRSCALEQTTVFGS